MRVRVLSPRYQTCLIMQTFFERGRPACCILHLFNTFYILTWGPSSTRDRRASTRRSCCSTGTGYAEAKRPLTTLVPGPGTEDGHGGHESGAACSRTKGQRGFSHVVRYRPRSAPGAAIVDSLHQVGSPGPGLAVAGSVPVYGSKFEKGSAAVRRMRICQT